MSLSGAGNAEHQEERGRTWCSDKKRAKEAGKRSGEARRRKARERLTADRVLEEFRPLETVDDAMQRL